MNDERNAWMIHEDTNEEQNLWPDLIFPGLLAIVAIGAVLIGWL